MIKAAIFDMDGLLIDSEPLWKEAEVKVFNSIGVPVTHEMTSKTLGMRTDEVVAFWHQRYPWTGHALETIAEEIDSSVLELIAERGQPKPGVHKVIAACMSLNLPMAIASSSTIRVIDAVVSKLGVGHHFLEVHSAQLEPYGKPHPGVYISVADKLGVRPDECAAFEDSPNGVISAKAAKMHCIAVPDPAQRDDKRFGIADMVVGSLNDVTAEMIRSL
jgi:mannitol-1-/sugar-/sorbitol-6-/2-deoxyglucose-6-phosphatase